jgi:hypothetical protein
MRRFWPWATDEASAPTGASHDVENRADLLAVRELALWCRAAHDGKELRAEHAGTPCPMAARVTTADDGSRNAEDAGGLPMLNLLIL